MIQKNRYNIIMMIMTNVQTKQYKRKMITR